MLGLRAIDLVNLWEQGCAGGCAERADLLLSRVQPESSCEELDALPLGIRDELLLQLREQVFGPRLESVLSCPGCNDLLEVNVDIHELRTGLETGDGNTAEWTDGDLSVRFRVPSGGDLRDLEGCENWEEARQRLLEHCVVEARRGDETVEVAQLTQEEIIALGERMAQVDPGSELMLNGNCPSCGHRWETLLDIASFLWHELDMQVERLLTEVHALAWAYSWSERDILTMSARRRQIYLDLLGR